MKKLKKTQPKKQTLRRPGDKLPFIEHIYELRRRLFYVALTVVGFGGIGYGIQQHLVSILLKPAAGQQFIYTSPGGGINFLFQICIYFGIIFSIPVIMYQLFRYMESLIPKHAHKFIIRSSFFSIILAMIGCAFGYFIGLPAALHFLGKQFTTDQIQPLFTIQEYMSFVSIYLVGSALLFQIPLVLMFINKIKPLKPRKLLKAERWVVLAAFVAAAIITPTPDIFNQVIIAGPIIVVYQFGVILVWIHNRRRKLSKLQILQSHDEELRQERLAKRKEAKLVEAPPLPVLLPSGPKLSLRPALATASSLSLKYSFAEPQNEAHNTVSLASRYRLTRPVARSAPSYQSRSSKNWSVYLTDIRPAPHMSNFRRQGSY